jgi:transposase
MDKGVVTISRYLKQEGIDVKIPGRRVGYAPKKAEFLPRVLELHGQGVTVYQIAKDVGVHAYTAVGWIKGEGLVPIYNSRQSKDSPKSGPKPHPQMEEGLRLYQKGFSEQAMAKAVGVSVTTAYNWVAKSGLQGKGGKYVQQEKDKEQAIALYNQGDSIEQIRVKLGRSYYVVQRWLIEGEVDLQVTGFRECAAADCREAVTSPDRKYHSEECRHKNQIRRQPDPSNSITFDCEGCGKVVTRYRKYGSGASRFCSRECSAKSNTNRLISVDSITLDSGWEALVWGLTKLLKVPISRFDRSDCIPLDNGWYGPDFLIDGIPVEVKGRETENSRDRYAAWRATGHKLVVVDKPLLDRLRCADREAFLEILNQAALRKL